MTLNEAARRLSVPLWVLRRAVFEGRVPAPAQKGALASVTAEWVAAVAAVAAESATALSRTRRQSVPPFARYEGTSAWTQHRRGSARAERAKALAAYR